MKKGILTLSKMEKLFKKASKYDQSKDFIIKWWQWPLLWFLPEIVIKEPSEAVPGKYWTFVYKKWNRTIYLVKTIDP